MAITYHSEYLKLQSVFIKPVKHAFLSDNRINDQWKSLNYLSRPNLNNALEEFELFQTYLSQKNIELLYFP